MEARITILAALVLTVAVVGGFVEVETAYEIFPAEGRTVVTAQRILWPWRDRWDTSWVPARSGNRSARTVDAARMYGLLPLRPGMNLDSLEMVTIDEWTDEPANNTPDTRR